VTADIAADLARLRAFLPPIYNDWREVLHGALDDERVIDLEWHSEICQCGRALPDGELELIGVGNPSRVVQIDWQAYDDEKVDRYLIRRAIEELVQRGTTIYHNADADIRKLREHGFTITAAGHARLEDTMLADAVTDSEEDHDLGDLNRRHGRLPDFKHLMHVAPREYNAGDLVGTYWVWKGLEKRFAADPQAHHVYRAMSIPFIDIAIEGEEAGVRVNGPVAVQLYGEYSQKVDEAVALGRAYTGDPLLGLNQHEKLKQLAHKVYHLPEQAKKGSDEDITLDKDALAVLRRFVGTEWDEREEPTLEQAVENILDGGNGLLEAKYLFSGANQRLTHYVSPCVELVGDLVVPRARIYPELRQHVQATGRHSYVGPALQQMKGATARLITPDPGTVWIAWDWSQIEVRLLAYLANDEVYLDAYERGLDIHEMNRVAIFGDGPVSADVKELQRGFVKRFVFRLHYRGLAKNAGDIPGCRALNLNVPRLVAGSEAYLAKHPALPRYWAKVEDEAVRTGMVRTFMGRPRRLTSPWPNARKREGCNHPMQGGVADIYCTTALLVKDACPWARLVFGAHDAQTWQVPEDRAGEFVAKAAPIANRRFRVNGHDAIFPAEFKALQLAA
jgi:DNA polymerase I-like protein with 3'-5' exonuclease and polymerase domains